ncbi:MAG: hypothetical protein V3U79_06825 [Dehalococcoidia bacterium]
MLPAPVKSQKKRYLGALFTSALTVLFIFSSCGDDEAAATPIGDTGPTVTPVADFLPTATPAVEGVKGSVYRNPEYPYSVIQPY